jgi:cell wall-associated NlpC family hydrolase
LFDDLIGVPYIEGGRDRKVGLDCYGLCIEVNRRIGIEIFEYISPLNEKSLIHEMIMKEKDLFLELKKPEPFCLVTFSFDDKYVTHIGVVLADKKRFIHTLKKTNCTIENLNHRFWQKKIRGYYKWIN